MMNTIVSADTTWKAGTTINLTGDVQIDSGVTLTVEPGVTINANGHQFLVVGNLVMDGDPGQQIALNGAALTFGSNSSTPGYMLLDNVRMTGGSFLAPNGNGAYGHFDLTRSAFTNVNGFYIWYPTSDSTIAQNLFDRSAGLSTGISGTTRLTIENNVFASQTTTFAIENWANYNGQLYVTGNSFLSTDKVALALRDGYSSASMLAENNYFGTTDPATINAMVLDRNDSLTRNAVIDISPWLNAPSPMSPSDDMIAGSDAADSLTVGLGNDTIDGGANIDTAVFTGNRAAYTITQTATGKFTVTGPDGTDKLSNVEFLKFDDQTIKLYPGTGTTVNFTTDNPASYMAAIRDFDGNDLGASADWKRIGAADVNGDGDIDQILVNRTIGRFAEVGTAPDGKVYFSDYSWGGETRVVGIYIDPLVQSGQVEAGGPFDSQRRFQNDLLIENINRVLGAADYDHDGLQEVYFKLTDGTAYLHAYMHADGNIRYANYQSQQQVIDFLTQNGWASSTWDGWFG